MISKAWNILFNKLKSIFIILNALRASCYLSPFGQINSSVSSFKLGKNVKIKKGHVLNVGKGNLTLDDNVWINNDCEINVNRLVEIGGRTTIQKNVIINGDVSIGSDVIIAPNVFLSSGSHLFNSRPHLPIRIQEKICSSLPQKKITIEDDVWLGINVVIMPGVTIAKGCVIGANSVVTKDTLPYSVYAGIPAKEISKRYRLSSRSVYEFTDPSVLPFIKSKIQYDFELLTSGKLSFALLEESFEVITRISFARVELILELSEADDLQVISLFGIEKKLNEGRNVIIWDNMQIKPDIDAIVFRFSNTLLTGIKLVHLKLVE